MYKNNSWKLSMESILVLFVALFPIMPTYCRITFLTATNFVALAFVLVVILWSKKIGRIRWIGVNFCIFAWVFLQIIIQIIHGYSVTTPLMLFIRFFAVFLILPGLVRSKTTFLKLIDTLIYISILISIFGIIESIFKFNIFELLNNSGANISYNQLRFGLRRIIGFTPQTITYCIYQVFIGALIFYRLTQLLRKRKRLWFRVAYMLSIISAILTLSRSALIFYFVIQMALLEQSGFTKFVKRISLLIVLGLLIAFLVFVFDQGAAKAISNFLLMFLAIFSENYSSQIAVAFGNDNLSAVGNRIQLYQWVWESVQNNKLIGVGSVSDFRYSYSDSNGIYTWTNTKTSIEVEWLSTLYEYGIVGLIGEIVMFVSIIFHELKKSRSINTDWEGQLGFGKFCFILTLGYVIIGFAVSFSLEDHLFFLIISLWLSYAQNHGYTDDEETIL